MLVTILLDDAYAGNATLNLFALRHLLLSRLLMVMSCQRQRRFVHTVEGEQSLRKVAPPRPRLRMTSRRVCGCRCGEGKHAALVLSSGSGSGPSEPGVMAQSTDAMHAAIRDFAGTDSASYLRLGELGFADLHQFCSEEEDDVPDEGVEGSV
ncbi:unnamed protein product [Lactuca virosa]|uniref:Uncharacterized protein n=1 Tax=Lactuca virosa TaxID=75947 RepID=A0AAU9MKI2_9ASTR|nr:unnamed protein product [Lactuca virosa]